MLAMIGIIVSRDDIASMNIAEYLLSTDIWRKIENDLYMDKNGGKILYFINDLHIYHNNVDIELKKLGYDIESIVFASRHASKSHKKTLSVHAIGNYDENLFGGKRKTLIPCNPIFMLKALTQLNQYFNSGYYCCYEATHHGPYLDTPCFFIEVGSTEEEWNDKQACAAIGNAIINLGIVSSTVAIGFGGGHYAPRFTEKSISDKIAFGHILPRYNIEKSSSNYMIKEMIQKTVGCTHAFFHGDYQDIKTIVKKHNVIV